MLGLKVDVRFLDNHGAQAASPLHDRVKFVDLEPQDDTMPGWRRVRVDEVGVFFLVPGMQLKKQLPGG